MVICVGIVMSFPGSGILKTTMDGTTSYMDEIGHKSAGTLVTYYTTKKMCKESFLRYIGATNVSVFFGTILCVDLWQMSVLEE